MENKRSLKEFAESYTLWVGAVVVTLELIHNVLQFFDFISPGYVMDGIGNLILILILFFQL